ncbi:MAG TPA: phosphoenolpyruvate--protein phosphotransferase [Alphaproteobacteria bacterium]
MRTELSRQARASRTHSGIGASAGVCIGPARLIEASGLDVAERTLPQRAVAAEQERFQAAVERARAEVEGLAQRAGPLPESARQELAFLLEAQLQMLAGSRLVRGVYRRIAETRVNAEAAVKTELSAIAEAFAAMHDPYLSARAQDVREVALRLIRQLTAEPERGFADLPEGAVLIAEELTPADIALLARGRIAGFATEFGGPQGHTAIMARSLALPAVVGVPALMHRVKAGETVVIDGTRGQVIVDPDAATVAAVRRRRSARKRDQRVLAKLRDLPAETRDGQVISLQANLELPAELAQATAAGAEGIGLLRTEFLYMNRDTVPDADEQYAALSRIVTAMGGRPVTVRTLDIGTDKLADALARDAATDVGANPALGLRAIRLSLRHRKLLEDQLEAMLRAAAHGPVRILLPMITVGSEVRQTRAVLRRVARRLARRGVALPESLPPLGAMVEIPAAALAAEALVRDCDFISIGTNDLTMYTLAVDRGDEHVAELYDPLHPAVLRLVQYAAEAAKRARVPVNLCGEIAGDVRYTALLIGLGLEDLSMAAASLPAVKRRIRALDAGKARSLAAQVMRRNEARQIATLIDAFNDAL